jgi:hypothetical protein
MENQEKKLKPKKPNCCNCKFASKQFKVVGKTHVHCHNEILYPIRDLKSGKLSAWDTLMDWHHVCSSHKFLKKS